MKRYTLDKEKFQVLLSEKIEKYFLAEAKKYEELNPTLFDTQLVFTPEEEDLLIRVNNGDEPKEKMGEELVKKIEIMNSMFSKESELFKKGEIVLDLFTIEEIISYFTFTKEEIEKTVLNGKETKSLQES